MRMLVKSEEPSIDEIKRQLGCCYCVLCTLEDMLEKQYDIKKELNFPFGNNYGWGYKYSHKNTHFFYAFFENDSFVVMLQIGDKNVLELEEKLDGLSNYAKTLWAERYPCGENSGWLHYVVKNEENLKDIISFVNIKKRQVKTFRNNEV